MKCLTKKSKILAIFKGICWPVVFEIGQFFLLFLLSYLLKEDINYVATNHVLLLSLLTLIIFIPLFEIYYKKVRKDFCKEKIKFRQLLNVCFLSFLVSFLLNIFFLIINRCVIAHMISGFKIEDSISITLIVSTGIVGPIIEEILFRGIIYNELKYAFTLKSSKIISSIIFAILHPSLFQKIYAFIIGYLIVTIYENKKNLILPIVFHITCNTISLIFMPLFAKANIILCFVAFILILLATMLFSKKIYKNI